MITRSHRVRIQIGLGMMLSVLCAADPAQARTETLVWEYSAPAEIAGFEVLYGTSSGNYNQVISVGMLPISGGAYNYELSVADDATVYIAVRAYASDGRSSALSNERVRLAPDSGNPPADSGESSGGDISTATPPAAFSPAGDLVLDFEDTQLGFAISDWLDTQANNSLSTDDSLFEIVDISGNQVLRTTSPLTNIHSHYTASGSQDWSGYEVRGAMLVSDQMGGIGVTAHSDYPNSDTYYKLRRDPGQSFVLSAHPYTSSYTCSNADTGVVPQAGVWYRFSFRVDRNSSSNRFTAKVWRDGETEPSSAQADCTDSSGSRPTSGTIGVWSMGAGTKYWDILDVSGAGVDSSGGSLPTTPEPPVLISVEPAAP